MNKKTLSIIGLGVSVLGAACAVIGKVVYDKVKSKADEDPEENAEIGSLGLPDNAVNESKAGLMKSQLEGVGSYSAENNDYPRISVSDVDFPESRRSLDSAE